LQAHNPKINWETGEVKTTRYLLLYERNIKEKEDKKVKKEKKVVTLEEEIIVR